MFKPVFNQNVSGVAPNGTKFQVNPMRCLTMKSARELKSILKSFKPEIKMGPPMPSGHFTYDPVPCLVFPDGKVRNAGQLAEYWVWFPGGDQAYKACSIDIEQDFTEPMQ